MFHPGQPSLVQQQLQGSVPPPPGGGRPGRRPPPGPGFYHRTLSSSSLFTSKGAQVAKSRSEYCGINQVCNRSGSNYDLQVLGYNNANLNPNIRNSISRSGNIVYRGVGSGSGTGVGSGGGISFVESAGVGMVENAPPPPERRLLVRALSRNANIPQYQQELHQYCWPQQQQQPHSYHLTNSFEQQYQLQQQLLQRKIAGSHPDISRCSGSSQPSMSMSPLPPFPQSSGTIAGSANPASPHQVSISMPSTSPQTTRRLLPRITTKKTENNSTVVLVGGTRTPVKGPFPSPNPNSSSSSDSYPISSNYISSGGRRTPEMYRKDIQVHPPFKKTDSDLVKDHHQRKHQGPSSVQNPNLFSASHQHHHHHHHRHHHHHQRGIPPETTETMDSRHVIHKTNEKKSSVKGHTSTPTSGRKDKRRKGTTLKVPSSLSPYYRNAPIKNLKHPLEENIFSSLFITLFAIAVALIVGVPLLMGIGVIAIGAVGIRYIIVVLHGVASYTRFICSERQHPCTRTRPPQIFPRDRLAFANDVRWLEKKGRNRCQSILHCLLVFEGSMDVATLRHLIQTRVLRAETPEGELAYPRLLQKLVPVTAGYLWELDLTFDIQNHIFQGPTHFTTEAQLQQYIGRLLIKPLPTNRPLWEIRMLPSYYGGGKDTMAIVRVHQCLADGMSLIRILSHNLSDYQQMHVPQRPHFAGMSFGFNVLRSLIVGPLTIFLWWFATFRDKNLFSFPLPRIRKRRRRRWFWQRWLVMWRQREFRDEGNDENEICYTSSIGPSSSSDSSLSSAHSSSVSSPCANQKGKFAQAFKSPLSSSHSSSTRKDELSPRASVGQQQNQLMGSPVSSTNRQNILSSDDTQVQGEDLPPSSTSIATAAKSSKSLMLEGILNKSKLNKCLSKKRSTSKSSLRSQQGGEAVGSCPQKKQNIEKSGKQGGSVGGEGILGRNKRKGKKKKRRRKRKGVGHSRKRRLLGRKGSLASASSLSGSSSSSCSSRCTDSSLGSPPAWNVIWSAPMTLPKVARIKQIMRSSYNDVLLSACAGSVRTYLQDLGVPYPGDFQVVIPVDLRNDLASPKQSTRLGCKVSSILATVPSGIESAIPRLWATRHRLDELKASADSVVAYGATTILMNILPHRIAIPILDTIINKASLQFSNLPGPTSTTVIGGFPVKGIYPIYPPPGRLRASVSVFTYADQVHITVITHRSLVDAGPKILNGMTDQVEQLSRQLSQRRVPGESRRSMRHFNQANNAEITKPPTRQIQLQLQVVQEELAQLNSQLEAQGIILSDQDNYGLGMCRVAGIPQGIQGTSSSTSYGGGGGGGGYYQQPPYHSTVQHHHGEQSSDEPCAASSSSEFSTPGQIELQNRLKSLKNEFAELIGELRRRSSIVEGIAMSFEEEESEEEYRKPRKRALSVVSMTRRSSIFSSRSNNTAPDSPVYSSDEELPSSPSTDMRSHQQQQPPLPGQLCGPTTSTSSASGAPPQCSKIRHASSPMRTTAV